MCNLYLYLIVFIVTLNASGSIKRNNYNKKNNGRRCGLLISKKVTRGAKKEKVCIGRTITLDVLHPSGSEGGGGGVNGVQMTGMIEGFRVFWGVGEFWQEFLLVA